MKKTKEFYETVRELERYEYKEFYESDIYSPRNIDYFYFSPSTHFRNKLITPEILDDIKDHNKRILSVGSGEAHLERFLTKLGIKNEQIILSDKYQVIPEGFEKYTFDMHAKWPKFRKKFDYIIFPQSVLLNVTFEDKCKRQKGLYHLIENSLATMKQTGQIRIDGHSQIEDNVNMVKTILETEHPNTKLTYSELLIVVEKHK